MLGQTVTQSVSALMVFISALYVCVCVCSRVGDQATSPFWIPSPLESGSSCFWPTWLSVVSSFWWQGKPLVIYKERESKAKG